MTGGSTGTPPHSPPLTAVWRTLRKAWQGTGVFTFNLHEEKHVIWTSASLRIALHACLHDTTPLDALLARLREQKKHPKRDFFSLFPKVLAACVRRTSCERVPGLLNEAAARARFAQSARPPDLPPGVQHSFLLRESEPSISIFWEGFLLGLATGEDVHFVCGMPPEPHVFNTTFCPTGRAAAHCLCVTLEASRSPSQEPPAMHDKLSDDLDMALFPCDGLGNIVEKPNRRAFEAFGSILGLPENEEWRRPVSHILFSAERDRESFGCTFEQFVDDILPFNFIASMLPSELKTEEGQWALTYTPIRRPPSASVDPAQAPSVLLVARLKEQDSAAGSRGDGDQAYIKALLADIDVSKGFLIETNAMISAVLAETDKMRLGRTLHTIKGNCGCFAMTSLAKHVHHLEDLLAEGHTDDLNAGLQELKAMWDEKIDIFQSFLKEDDASVVITKDEFDELNMDLMSNRDWSEILGIVQKWSMELVDVRFRRLELQLERFAGTAEKQVKVKIGGNGTRLPRKGLQEFWASLVHILRNVVDHGLDTPEERTAQGKSPVPTVTFGVTMTEDDAILSIADDGRGIAWQKVEKKALERGLPAGTREDLVNALFAQGLSTQENVSLQAGRGVGLSAVKDELLRLNGTVSVTSEAGQGTTFSLAIPLATLANLQLTAN